MIETRLLASPRRLIYVVQESLGPCHLTNWRRMASNHCFFSGFEVYCIHTAVSVSLIFAEVGRCRKTEALKERKSSKLAMFSGAWVARPVLHDPLFP